MLSTALPMEKYGAGHGVLEEREIQRLGEHTTRAVDVRVIALTNRDLAEEVVARRFREDLYYRLNVFPIHLPPLRERKEDIAFLAEHFLQLYSQEQDKIFKSPSGMQWQPHVCCKAPGNGSLQSCGSNQASWYRSIETSSSSNLSMSYQRRLESSYLTPVLNSNASL